MREAAAEWWRETDAFWRIVLLSAAAHMVGLTALHVVEPSAVYTFVNRDDALRSRGIQRTAEPLRPIAWQLEMDAWDGVHIKSAVPLTTLQIDRLREIHEVTERLLTNYYAIDRKRLPTLELRFVPLWMMNDPAYFQVDKRGTYYGRYFPSDVVAYLSPVAFERENHVVHELTHHFVHEYGLEFSKRAHESVAHNFEKLFERYEGWLGHEHVLSQTPEALATVLDAKPAKNIRVRYCDEGERVEVRAPKHLRTELACWAHREMERVFPFHAGVPPVSLTLEPPGPALRVTVIHPNKIYATTGHWEFAGLYLEDRNELLVSRQQVMDETTMAHLMTHHYMDRFHLWLSDPDAETLAELAPRAIERVNQGEVPWSLRPVVPRPGS